jgi:hypothetical protein
MQWLRWWHNTASDPKWINVARKANANVGQVVSVWAALLEHASQATPRGGLADFHEEDTDAMYGYEPGTTFAIVRAMGERGVLDAETNSIARWDERQPKREDFSTERSKRHRNAVQRNATQVQRSATHGNAPDTDTDTEKRREEQTPPSGGGGGVGVETSDAPKVRIRIPDSWAMAGAEGPIAALADLYNPAWVQAAVNQAATKQVRGQPADLVGGILRRYAQQGGPDAPPTLKLATTPTASPETEEERKARLARWEAEEDAIRARNARKGA